MRKGNKVDYLNGIKNYLGDLWIQEDYLPPSNKPTVLVVDAMAFIQCYPYLGSNTFGELQEAYLKKLISIALNSCNCKF